MSFNLRREHNNNDKWKIIRITERCRSNLEKTKEYLHHEMEIPSKISNNDLVLLALFNMYSKYPNLKNRLNETEFMKINKELKNKK